MVRRGVSQFVCYCFAFIEIRKVVKYLDWRNYLSFLFFQIFQAVLPETNIKNFTSDWSNGINLSALLDYCQPGLMPNWRNLNPNDGPNNCQRAMEVAEKHFKIPLVSKS